MQTADSPTPQPTDAPQQKFIPPLDQGFDPQHPPEQGLIDACVHCGFCLTTCPSYRVIGKEMDSPRGRIYLMDAINKGEVPFSETAVEHFDSCLGCLACTTACPSGVQYDQLIAAVRPQITRNHPRSLPGKLLRTLIFSAIPLPRSHSSVADSAGSVPKTRRLQTGAGIGPLAALVAQPGGDGVPVAQSDDKIFSGQLAGGDSRSGTEALPGGHDFGLRAAGLFLRRE